MSALLAILVRDLTLSVRAQGGAGLGIGFFALILALLPLGLGPDASLLKSAAGGLIWIAAMLATLISLDRLFQADLEDGTLDHLILSAEPLEAIVLAKALAHWLSTGFMLALGAPLMAPMLGIAWEQSGTIGLTLLLGTPALTLTGAIAAALSAGVRRGGLLIAILTLPLYVPVLVFGAGAVTAAAEGRDAGQALLLLSAMSLFGLALAPFAAAAALRANLQ